jgi:heptosyltransferase-2
MAFLRSPERIASPSVLETRRRALAGDARAGRVRRVLAVRFNRLGDVVFTTPALSLLAEKLPGVRIDYLTSGAARALVSQHPAVAEVLRFDPGRHRPGHLRRRARLRREIAARGYDLALVFESDRPTRNMLERLCRAAGVRHVVSRSSYLAPPGAPGAQHSCEKHMQLLSMLDLAPDERSYELFPPPDDAARAEVFLREHGVDAAATERPLLVGVQAGCHYSRVPEWLLRAIRLRHKFHKAWPYARWSEVGQLLCDGLGARVVLTGAAGERSIAEGIARGIRAPGGLEPIVAAGETSVGVLAALVARMDLFLSIDTGTMHMAAALGVPTVALFGPTNPGHHGPYRRPDSSVVLRSGVDCSPCRKSLRKACTLNRCMTELSAQRVFEVGHTLVASQRRAVREVVGR